jgi:small subunit ribosomal protein S1
MGGIYMTDEQNEVLTETVAKSVPESQEASPDVTGTWNHMQALFESGETLQVTIKDSVKGGLVADVGVRAFIPASLVDRKFVSDLSEFNGQVLDVKVVELDQAANRLILSRRAVLEEQETEKVSQILKNIHEGDVFSGTVQRLTNFGAFVDIGGVDGLVHVSELSHTHVAHPSDVVQPGDKVQVKVLRVDPSAGKVSLSVREVAPGPWEQYQAQLNAGEIVTGVVKRVVDFGAFVELFPGLEGLVHISQLSNEHVAKAEDVVKPGQEVKVKVLSVDVDRKRVSLSMKEAATTSQRREVKKFVEKQNEVTSGTGATIGDLFGDLFKEQR